MAQNYQDTTGVLVLDKVTPVISALFGGFDLDESYPGNGKAYIAKSAEGSDPQWDDILENLQKLAVELGLSLPDDAEESVDEYLMALATHFGADADVELGNLIEHHDFADSAELGDLFEIAIRFDDGHGLRAMNIETGWYCSKPRLYEFGGSGEYYSRNVYLSDSSSRVTALGEAIDSALTAGDLDDCAGKIFSKVNTLLAGIPNDETREVLRVKLCELLTASRADPTNSAG